MKNKNQKKKLLTQDLIKYSEQMGIVSIPRLVFNPQDYRELSHTVKKIKRDRWLGLACRSENVIMVNLDYHGPVWRKEYKGTKNNRYYILVKGKWDLREARETLVHELIHIRWKMGHGYNFAKRIDEILKGKRFD